MQIADAGFLHVTHCDTKLEGGLAAAPESLTQVLLYRREGGGDSWSRIVPLIDDFVGALHGSRPAQQAPQATIHRAVRRKIPQQVNATSSGLIAVTEFHRQTERVLVSQAAQIHATSRRKLDEPP